MSPLQRRRSATDKAEVRSGRTCCPRYVVSSRERPVIPVFDPDSLRALGGESADGGAFFVELPGRPRHEETQQ